MRKDVYLVTKNAGYRAGQGQSIRQVLEEHLNASLERLQTDYIDCYFLHGIAGRQLEILHRPRGEGRLRSPQEVGQDPLRRL